MTVPADFREKVKQLVDKFESNKTYFLSTHYSESQARIDFIDKLFEALGWSITLKPGEKPYDREVIVERGQTKGRPDYNFRINRQTKFFVEAKAPHVSISKSDVILQAKKYAWNNSNEIVYFAVVTDFHEFRFYDASRKPDPKHPETGLIFDYTYDQYTSPKASADLWQLSREAVASGSLDKLISPKARAARLKTPLDQQFLHDLSNWREELAKAVYKAHPDFSPADLNSVVQVFLDRLIFIRIAEDRGALPGNRLRDIARIWRDEGKQRPITADLIPLFHEINEDLNGEIFKPHKCEEIKWDSELVADIIEEGLEPYNFAQIGVELLGSIYERYLGKTIRVTAKRAIIEEKPEVRKAGGVYYTPNYIVDYIVEQTVGRLINGRTPKQIKKLKIIDPACGSGSFLIGAYQKLLDYHTYYKANKTKKHTNKSQLRLLKDNENEEVKLTLIEKATILCNNIYGVDIDPQAVEITMMSLYIKMLEDEKGVLSGRSLLPRLRDNIKCGNSLIGYDIGILSDDKKAHINPFDWNSKSEGFGKIMVTGGFDSVISNPPWGSELGDEEQQYLVKSYPLVPTKTKDSYFYFISKAIDLLRNSGFLGFIVPNTWLLINNAKEFRRRLLAMDVKEIIDHGDGVFNQATVESATFVLAKSNRPDGKVRAVRIRKNEIITDRLIDKRIWIEDEFSRIIVDVDERTKKLLDKLKDMSDFFAKSCVIKWGIKPYQIGLGIPPQTREMLENRVYHSTKMKGKDWKPLLVGSDVNRYSLHFPGNLFIKYGKWLMYPSDESLMLQPKILMRQTSDVIRACYDDNNYYCQNSVFIIHSDTINMKYLLGLLNSKLLSFVYKLGNPQTGKVFAEIKPSVIKQLPIRRTNFANTKDKSQHDKIVSYVESILNLQKAKQNTKSDVSRKRIEREINVLDERIDEAVYQLYKLTKTEISVVENK